MVEVQSKTTVGHQLNGQRLKFRQISLIVKEKNFDETFRRRFTTLEKRVMSQTRS